MPGQEDPGTVGWSCYDPFVDVTVTSPAGAGVTTLRGTSRCGTTVATCAATTTPTQPAGHCSNAAFPEQPVPLVCEADFSAALPTATWSVRCAPVDP